MRISLFVLANRLTVAVSDVLNPNIDDMSRGVGPLGYGTTQGDFSPQVSLYLHVIASSSYSGFWQKKRVRKYLLIPLFTFSLISVRLCVEKVSC